MKKETNLFWVKNTLDQIENLSAKEFSSWLSSECLRQKNDILNNFIRSYLYFFYGIDGRFNTVIEQVDHYSFLLNLDLKSGYTKLMNELLEIFKCVEASILPIDVEKGSEHLSKKPQRHNSLALDIKSIAPGVKIILGNKIQKDFKETKFFDKKIRNPCWNLFYGSDNQDFNFVNIYSKDDHSQERVVSERAYRVFSGVCDTIEHIDLDGTNKTTIYTSVFEIDLINALASGEVKILNSEIEANKSLAYLKEDLKNYSIGMSQHTNFALFLADWLLAHIHDLHPEWVNFQRNMNGEWFKINKENTK
ncbi:hypothetical protein [Neolewinella persica]|uniref:hypothetical protein n=1 Tax=Neolewinella persica TaxID=70998 RepID=UPI000377C970|nr:hypothetical protein [Neolewinella persica]